MRDGASRDGRVSLDFADGNYSFRIGIGQWAELQEKCDSGPLVIFQRLLNNDWRVEDVHTPIRLGLMGGGMQANDALKLMRRYVDDTPPLHWVSLATAIIQAGVIGAPEEAPGEPSAASGTKGNPTHSPTENSVLPPSTEPGQ